MSEITLSKAVRSNLLNLQSTANLMSKTQERLATGLKVNSALDNPTNFFTASSLNSRAGDLSQLLDSVSNAVQTLAAADKGITAITKLVESAQATARQALQTAPTVSETTISGGSSATSASVSAGAFTTVNVSNTGSDAEAASVTAGTFSALNLAAQVDAGDAVVSGGAVTSVDVSQEFEAATSATVAGGAFDTLNGVDFTNGGTNDGSITFNINVDGAGVQAISIGFADVSALPSNGAAVTAEELAGIINDKINAALGNVDPEVYATVNDDGGIDIASASQGQGSTLVISDFAAAGGATGSGLGDGVGQGLDEVEAASISFSLTVNGEQENITIDAAAVDAYNLDTTSTLNAASLSAEDLAAIINHQFGAEVVSVSDDDELVVTGAGSGLTAGEVSIGAVTTSSTVGGTHGLAAGDDTGSAGEAADSLSFTVTVNGTPTAVTLNAAVVQQYNDDNTATLDAANLSADDVALLINDQVGSEVASVNDDGDLVFTSTTEGDASTIALSAVTGSATAGSTGISVASDSGADAEAADSISFSLNVNGAGAQTITINATTAADAGFNDPSALTAANIAAIINDQAGASVASVDGDSGNLVLASSTFGTSSSVAITGYSASVTSGSTGISNASDTGDAAVAGTPTTTDVTNPKRDELRQQYNELLSQIDGLAKDAGFNGVNLLMGESLSVLFNEDGSSQIDIQGQSFTSTGLGLTELSEGAFTDNDDINAVLTTLKGGIETLRTQASKFGSNLSVVETRQDFTKNMINVLQTGAANLTLADTNEEAANLLALQTRQQLSSTALSLASQADQQVLRLF